MYSDQLLDARHTLISYHDNDSFIFVHNLALSMKPVSNPSCFSEEVVAINIDLFLPNLFKYYLLNSSFLSVGLELSLKYLLIFFSIFMNHILIINKPGPWWPSGLIHHVSNSSRDRQLGPKFKSHSGHTQTVLNPFPR